MHDERRQAPSTRDSRDGCVQGEDALFHLAALAAAVLLAAMLLALT